MPANPTPTAFDRLLYLFRALLQQELPNLRFLGVYEYAVQAVDASTGAVDAVPTDTTIGLPGITKVPLRFPVITAQLTVPCMCLIGFVNGDPTRPYVLSGDPIAASVTVDATGTLKLGPSATAIQLAGGGAAVARVGDHIKITTSDFSAAGTQAGGMNVTNTSTDLMGTIVGGSSKVTCG